MWEIYKITRDIDDAVYYGQHKVDTEDSYYRYGDKRSKVYFGSGIHIKRSVIKYGFNEHHKEVICIVPTNEWANRCEQCVIRFAKLNKENLLNIADGGQGGRMSDDIVIRRGLSISKVLKGRPPWNKGVPGVSPSLESRKKNSLSNIASWKKRHEDAVSFGIYIEKLSRSLTGIKRSDETRALMSVHRKGLKYFTNGVIERKCRDCPEGFHPGRSPNVRKVPRGPNGRFLPE